MDINETLDRLRNELHDYHVDVKQLITRFDAHSEDLSETRADVYGIPGQQGSIGLMGEVADLRQSRKILRLGLRGVWVTLIAMVGAVTAWVLR